MTRRREAGLLAWPLILVAALTLFVPSASAQTCPEAFDTEVNLSGFDGIVDIVTNVNEETSAGTEMYTLSWIDCNNVVPPEITDADFTKYFTVDDTQDCLWVVSLNKSLIGVPDYPDPTTTISTTVIFTGFAIISYTECSVTLRHTITDQNTQHPVPQESTYTVDIKEDLSPGYTIAGFSTSVHDTDQTSPNNQFSVLAENADCPLEATQVSYTSGQNPQLVEYQLKQAVDYEATKTITCTMTFTDDGVPTLSDSATITINVEDMNDEPPKFEYEYYYSQVSSVVIPGEELDIQPAPISASDGDININDPITYSMRNANEDVNGLEYFSINTTTGEVNLKQDLQEDFLLNERVLFFVEASDDSLQASAVLEVMLPPVPTTTAATSPATTCEPCTCPTPTTELPTECPTTPTEVTCTPCPSETTTECDCPTTPTEGTCTPCPTETTTDLVCPTTATEGTCTPCPTETTTECVCPTTATEGTCTPCPTDATTECVCPTTPTEGPTTTTTITTVGPTVTWDPNLPPLTFKKESYVADIYPSHTEFLAVEVEDIEGYTVEYSIRGEGDKHFIIDANTGMISVDEEDRPPVALYKLQAVATITTVPTQRATTMVTINVLPLTVEEVVIQSSVIRASVNEGVEEQDLGDINLYSEASGVCVTGAEPSNLKDRFTIQKKSDTVWTLKKTGSLNYEETHEVTLSIRAYKANAPTCADVNEVISGELLKSEALAIIAVNDINDEAPVFSSDNLVAGYPINEGLKRVVGPVISVHADDKDSEDVRYSVTGTDAAQFTVDEVTGDVYGVEGLTCDDQCDFNVTALDGGGKKNQVSVKVLPLDTEHVFTIVMPDTALSEVDDKLKELSDAAEAQISMLYVSPTETTTRRGRTRYRRDTTTSLQVHVYSIKGGKLMSQADLNKALQAGSSDVQAEAFIDAEVFADVEEVDTTGLKVAVGVLGGLLGVILIASVAFFIYRRRKGSSGAKTQKPPTPISTLGQAYHNPSYTNDTSQVNLGSGSLGHKSNGSLNGYPGGGSLNGYTSAEVHRHPDQDSPPLHRSPLAPPVDAIPLRTRDSNQQGGLKRTNPGAPEFYGSSSPAPPPSFSSSSSHPIYAEVKKPKPSTSTDRKYLDNSDDDDDLGDTKFASVRRSPPPRRSAKPDDDDDDANGDVAYPGGKHVGFQDEPAEDEKKSVAFKVKVETKEIEAENKGPAQKKAEAAALMEANRQKMQEEGDDEEEDEEEESMKL